MNSRRLMTGIGFPPTDARLYQPATAVAQSVCPISSLPMEGSARVVALARERADVRGGSKPGLPPWEPYVRFRRVQTLVREGSPFVKLRNSA